MNFERPRGPRDEAVVERGRATIGMEVVMLLLLVTLALADIPPAPGYVEDCTLANHAAEGNECTMCSGNFRGREDCEALEKDGYSKACRTAGASVWDEVMCRSANGSEADPKPAPVTEPDPDGYPTPGPGTEPDPDADPSPPVPDPAKRRRCDTVGGPSSLWVLPFLLGLSRRRRE